MTQVKVDRPIGAAPGSQTLARGLCALQLVAASRGGLTIQQVADSIGVHRTIAYRLLSTLATYRLVAKGDDGRFRSAAGLAALGASFDNNVRELSLPILRELADGPRDMSELAVAVSTGCTGENMLVPDSLPSIAAGSEGSSTCNSTGTPSRRESVA